MKCWIFDCDGVILDSMYFWNHMTEMYLRKEGKIPEKNLSQKLFSMNYEQGCRYIGEKYFPKRESRKTQKDLNWFLEDYYYNYVKEKEGGKKLLQSIQKRKERIVIVTSTPKYLVEAALKRLNLKSYIEEIFSATDLHMSKSQPYIYQKAMDFLKATPQEIYYVEDGLYAIEMGKKMGFQTIGIYDRENEKDWEKIQEKSDWTFCSLDEMERRKYEIYCIDNCGK